MVGLPIPVPALARVTQVLDTTSYRRVSEAFRAILEPSTGNREGQYRFTKSDPNYDAWICPSDAHLAGLFMPLFSEGWDRFYLILFCLSPTRAVSMRPFIRARKAVTPVGLIMIFVRDWSDEVSTASEGPVFANRSACDYFTGQIKNASASPKEYVPSRL